MDKEKNKSTRQMVIMFAVIIVLILIAAMPKKETFVCVSCGETVTQIPKAAPLSLTGHVGYHDYTHYELDDREKLCDECYGVLETYQENESK